jgi:hypothetical protein
MKSTFKSAIYENVYIVFIEILCYSLSILKVTFLKSNPFRLKETLISCTISSIVVSAIVPVYKDVSALVLFMLFYVLFLTMLCINNHTLKTK